MSQATRPLAQVGEVCIRGPNVTAGYLNNPKANAEAYTGGWFHTGDQGVLDKDGFLTLVGRIKVRHPAAGLCERCWMERFSAAYRLTTCCCCKCSQRQDTH